MAGPQEASSRQLLAVPVLVGAMASFQLGASIAKSLFPLFGPTGTVGLRLSLSLLVLAAIWRPWRQLPNRAALRVIVPYGLSLGIMNLLFYLALARLPLGVAVSIEFTGPLGLAIIGSRRLPDLLWVALVVGGLVLLLDPATALHGLDPLGMAFALGAGLFWALYIVFGQRVGRRVTGTRVTAFGLAVACLAVVPFCLPAMLPAARDPAHLLDGLLVAILSTALPYSLEMAAMRWISMRSFGILMSLDPVLAALSGLAFLGERLSLLHWLAILCIVLASAGTALTAGADPKPNRPEPVGA